LLSQKHKPLNCSSVCNFTISNNILYKFINNFHSTLAITETFTSSPIELHILYNSRSLAYAFLVLHSSIVESSESQNVMSDSFSFSSESELLGDLMSVEESFMVLLK